MKKIYIVTSGSYSDYGIDAVFSTKELAEIFVSRFGEDMNIEEWDLDKGESELREGHSMYFLRISKDKDVLDARKETGSYGFKYGTMFYKDIDGNHIVHLFAKDEEHAKKIALDKLFHLNN